VNTVYYNPELIKQTGEYVEELEKYFVTSWKTHGWNLKNISDKYPFSNKKKLLLENIGKLHEACSIERPIETEMQEARNFDALFALQEDPDFNGGLLNDFSVMNLYFRPESIVEKNKIIVYSHHANLIYIPDKNSLNELIDSFIESFNPNNIVFKNLYTYIHKNWHLKEIDYRLYGIYIRNLEKEEDSKIIYNKNVCVNRDIFGDEEFNEVLRNQKEMYWVNQGIIKNRNLKLEESNYSLKRVLLYKYISEKAVYLSENM
jgi:hypothetical protein